MERGGGGCAEGRGTHHRGRDPVIDREEQKRAAAERAVDHVESGMKLGLGTGSTAKHVLDVLHESYTIGSNVAAA